VRLEDRRRAYAEEVEAVAAVAHHGDGFCLQR